MKYTGIFLLLVSFMACQPHDGKVNLQPFYYPLDSLSNGRVYSYESVGNPYDPPIFWLYQSRNAHGSTLLTGTSYDLDFQPDQYVVERRVKNGMKLDTFITYEAVSEETKLEVAAQIEAGNVFPFRLKDENEVLLTTVKWHSETSDADITFVRNRQYLADTTVVFKGDTLPAVRILLRELIDTDREGHLELEYGGEEVYAKGIGLVYFEKNINPEWQMKYALQEIYERPYFERVFGVKLSTRPQQPSNQ